VLRVFTLRRYLVAYEALLDAPKPVSQRPRPFRNGKEKAKENLPWLGMCISIILLSVS
jgi:hypothetical protein